MEESKARYLSLIIIGIEALLVFLPLGLIFLGMTLPSLSIQGNELPSEVVIFLLAFFGIGSLLVLSAFFKIFFYILTISEVILLIFYTVDSRFNLMVILLYLMILAPHIFYYTVTIKKSLSGSHS